MTKLEAIWNDIEGTTALEFPRIDNLYHVTMMADKLDGEMVECGVFGGGSAYAILSTSGKPCHLYDSFTGIPEPTIEDRQRDDFGLYKGAYMHTRKYAEDFLSKFSDRYIIHEGYFCDTLPKSKEAKYSLVHLDVDLYQSYKDCLEYFVPRMVSGGYIICDEYRFHYLPGATQAIDEYFGDVEALNHWHVCIQLTIRF